MVTLKTKKTKPEGKLTNSKHTKEIKLCNICYDEKNNKFIKCPKCKKNNSCRNCWESNIKIKSSITKPIKQKSIKNYKNYLSKF